MTTHPSYRAPDLLTLALHWLRRQYPDAHLIPELSIGEYGSLMLDVAAVTDAEIVGVEIKGAGDSPQRLERQGWTYGQVATRMWLLPTPELEARCWKKRPERWGQLVVRDGQVVVRTGEIHGNGRWEDCPDGGRVWRQDIVGDEVCDGPLSALRPYQQAPTLPFNSPGAMVGAMWADEMRPLMGGGASRMSANRMRETLREAATVREVRKALCHAIRTRDWGKGVGRGKTVCRPGDDLPPLPDLRVLEAVP